jgi:hypothetical protein
MLSSCDDLLDDNEFENREPLSEKLFAAVKLLDASHA